MHEFAILSTFFLCSFTDSSNQDVARFYSQQLSCEFGQKYTKLQISSESKTNTRHTCIYIHMYFMHCSEFFYDLQRPSTDTMNQDDDNILIHSQTEQLQRKGMI